MTNKKKTSKALRLTIERSISQLRLTVLPSHRFSHQQQAQCIRSVRNRKQATFDAT